MLYKCLVFAGQEDFLSNIVHLSNVGSMLGQRRRRWSSIKTALDQCLVWLVSCNQFSGYINAVNLYSIGYCWPTLDRLRHARFAAGWFFNWKTISLNGKIKMALKLFWIIRPSRLILALVQTIYIPIQVKNTTSRTIACPREGHGAMARAQSFADVAACRTVSNPTWYRIFREISCFSPLNIGTLFLCCVLGQGT